MAKKKTKLKISMAISIFIGITFGYFTWLTWDKLTTLIGNSNIVWAVTGGIVLVAIMLGYFGINKIVDSFT